MLKVTTRTSRGEKPVAARPQARELILACYFSGGESVDQCRNRASLLFACDLNEGLHQRHAIHTRAKLVELIEAHINLLCNSGKWIVEKILWLNTQRRRNPVYSARPNAVQAVFIFLKLLERNPDLPSKFGLTHPKLETS